MRTMALFAATTAALAYAFRPKNVRTHGLPTCSSHDPSLLFFLFHFFSSNNVSADPDTLDTCRKASTEFCDLRRTIVTAATQEEPVLFGQSSHPHLDAAFGTVLATLQLPARMETPPRPPPRPRRCRDASLPPPF